MLNNIIKKMKYNFDKKLVKFILKKKIYQKRDPDLHQFILMFGSLVFQLYRSGMVLGLYDLLDKEEGLKFEELSQKLQIENYPLKVLLNSLEFLQVILKIGEKYYNNPTITFSALKKHNKLFSMNSTIEYFNMVVDPTFTELPTSIKENKPMGLYKVYGEDCNSFYEEISNDPTKVEYFSTFMQGFTNVNTDEVTSESIFGKCKNILDVGGNKGVISVALAKKHPKLKATVFDYPEVIKLAQQRFEKHNLSNRLSVLSGNALESIPAGYDCMTMFHFIDIFSPEQNKIILKNIYDALPDKGIVCIFTPITYLNKRCVNDLMGSYFLNLANGKGEFYNVEEIKHWLGSTKFSIIEEKYFTFNEVFLVAQKNIS